MSQITRLFGILGAVFVLLGLASSFFVGVDHVYSMVHWSVGAVCILVFLGTNIAQLRTMFAGRATRQFTYTLVFGLALLITLVAANVMVVKNPRSFDVTQDALYTLSDQSQQVLGRLEVPVHAWLFVPGGQGGPLEDLLRQYDYASDLFHFATVDPEIDLDKVRRFELSGDEPVVVLEAGSKFVKAIHMSEEAITARLVELEGGRKKIVYFLTEHGEMDLEDDKTTIGAKLLANQLRNENFEVIPLNLIRTGQVPDNADAVVILGAEQQLLPQEVTQLQRYLKFGGNLLLASDPGFTHKVDRVLEYLGVTLNESVIVDQQMRMFAGPQLGLQPLVSTYGEHPIAEPMQGARTTYQMACHITHEAVEGVSVTELAFTSESAWAETDMQRLFEEQQVGLDDADAQGPVPLAVAIEGYAAPGTTEPPLVGTAKLAVFCDSDFLSNQWVGQMANMDLAVNTLNWLTGKEQEISIRPKSRTVSNLVMTADEMTNIFFLTVLIFPETLLLLGLFVWWRRR